jgi:hypothetical protein
VTSLLLEADLVRDTVSRSLYIHKEYIAITKLLLGISERRFTSLQRHVHKRSRQADLGLEIP